MTNEVFANSPNPGRVAAVAQFAGNGGQVTAVATGFNVGAPLPTALQSGGQFHALVDSELMIIPCQASTALAGVTRGVEGSAAAAHLDGAQVIPLLTAGAIQNALAGAIASAESVSAAGVASEALRATTAETTKSQDLVDASVVSGAQTLTAGRRLRFDISGVNGIATLPTAPAEGSRCAVKVVKVNATPGTYTLVLGCGGSDVFDATGGSTSITLRAVNQAMTVRYRAAEAVWVIENTDSARGMPLGSAVLGSDGTLGGVGGSALGSSVVTGAATTKTAAYSVQPTDHVVLLDATGGSFPVTLPSAVGFSGRLTLDAITASSNLVAVNTTSGQTVDGNASGAITLGTSASGAPFKSIDLISDSANWRIV